MADIVFAVDIRLKMWYTNQYINNLLGRTIATMMNAKTALDLILKGMEPALQETEFKPVKPRAARETWP